MFTYLIFIKAFFNGVNLYVHKSGPMEIMKISIHFMPSRYLSIVCIFGSYAMKETFRR